MAHPFMPMTNRALRKLARRVRESISTTKFFDPRVVLKSRKDNLVRVTIPPDSETNPDHRPT